MCALERAPVCPASLTLRPSRPLCAVSRLTQTISTHGYLTMCTSFTMRAGAPRPRALSMSRSRSWARATSTSSPRSSPTARLSGRPTCPRATSRRASRRGHAKRSRRSRPTTRETTARFEPPRTRASRRARTLPSCGVTTYAWSWAARLRTRRRFAEPEGGSSAGSRTARKASLPFRCAKPGISPMTCGSVECSRNRARRRTPGHRTRRVFMNRRHSRGSRRFHERAASLGLLPHGRRVFGCRRDERVCDDLRSSRARERRALSERTGGAERGALACTNKSSGNRSTSESAAPMRSSAAMSSGGRHRLRGGSSRRRGCGTAGEA